MWNDIFLQRCLSFPTLRCHRISLKTFGWPSYSLRDTHTKWYSWNNNDGARERDGKAITQKQVCPKTIPLQELIRKKTKLELRLVTSEFGQDLQRKTNLWIRNNCWQIGSEQQKIIFILNWQTGCCLLTNHNRCSLSMAARPKMYNSLIYVFLSRSELRDLNKDFWGEEKEPISNIYRRK